MTEAPPSRTAPLVETRDSSAGKPAPLVSVAIAAYNCEDFLEEAVASALDQGVPVEVIIVDDVSSDGTAQLARRLARDEARIRALSMESNGGPAAARNAALDAARGEWFAVLDADDFYAPDRLRQLVEMAEADQADLIADDLIVFDNDNVTPPSRYLRRHKAGSREWLTLTKYLNATRMFSRRPNLGFLKPVFRLSSLREAGIRYDERLRIGEDDLLVLQMLMAGMRYRLAALPGYFYRKHSTSISHRLSQANIDQISLVTSEVEQALGSASPEEKRAFRARKHSVRTALGFVHFVDHVKAGQWRQAAGIILENPSVLRLVPLPLTDRLGRWASRRIKPRSTADAPHPKLNIATQRTG
ncbi:glycosyltransferase family 2 protein [Alteraurantiacibacter aquimixticola]|nr:glycosyltransferase family 2 protein [Alteraurantiacibacter aquimixticola]